MLLQSTVAGCSRCLDYEPIVERLRRKWSSRLNWEYWGRLIHGFGDPPACVYVFG